MLIVLLYLVTNDLNLIRTLNNKIYNVKILEGRASKFE